MGLDWGFGEKKTELKHKLINKYQCLFKKKTRKLPL